MNANELRIGSYYKYSGNESIVYAKVKAIQVNNFGLLSDIDGTNYGICEPIPLTEEWLVNFGFVKQIKSPSLELYLNKNFVLRFDPQDKFQFYINGNYININNVHQLQNLYFALTGEELALNNETAN